MDELRLKIKMRDFGDTRESLARAMGLTDHTLYMKMRAEKTSRVQQFNQKEIQFIAERYNLTPEEIAEIFFAKVGKKV